jgi:hypothetical protein
MLLTVVWALDAPITATGGSDVLVAWAPAPFFGSFWLCFFVWFLLFAWVDMHF